MKIVEAINKYNKDKDKTALFESVYFSNLKEKECIEVLKDTLKEGYSDLEFNNWRDTLRESYIKNVSSPFKMDEEEWEQAYGVSSFEEIFG